MPTVTMDKTLVTERFVVAIDPLALIFPNNVYLRLMEKFHPHVPKIEQIAEFAKTLPAEERKTTLKRAEALADFANGVHEALTVHR